MMCCAEPCNFMIRRLFGNLIFIISIIMKKDLFSCENPSLMSWAHIKQIINNNRMTGAHKLCTFKSVNFQSASVKQQL